MIVGMSPLPAPARRPSSSPGRAGRRLLVVVLAGALGAAEMLLAAAPAPARAQGGPPQRNLLIELRQVRAVDVDEAAPGTSAQRTAPRDTTLSTRSLADELPPPQQLRLLNGQRGQLRNSRRLPVLWMQSAAARQGDAGGGGSAGAVSYQLLWLEAGQAMNVQATWPGGRAPAHLELSASGSTVEAAPGQPVPTRQQRSASTTLVTPLGRWTTFAAIGDVPAATPARAGKARVLSTRDLQAGRDRQLLQVRVSAE
jgi:hypothetical protein